MKRWPIWLIGGGALLVALIFGLNWLSGGYLLDGRRLAKRYSIPSESMSPTLEVSDVVMPRRFEPGDLRRGTILVIRVGAESWIERIAGLPGDTLQMRDGIVILNGKPVAQRPDGQHTPLLREGGHHDPEDMEPAARRIERFPGEPRAHRILDQHIGIADNSELFTVPAGYIFMLGDNRDNSADSRFSRSQSGFAGGLGMVPVTDIIGVIDFIYWSKRFGYGHPIDE